MKIQFAASLCDRDYGTLGGVLEITENELVYRNGRKSLPEKANNVHIALSEIDKITQCRAFVFPAVLITSGGANTHKFLIFRRKGFIRALGFITNDEENSSYKRFDAEK